MPTGYTADVQSGKVTEFRDFAMQCARAMGACVTMRDDPQDAPIPEFKPSEYYETALREARDKLAAIEVESEADARAAWMAEYQQDREYHRKQSAEERVQQRRYEAMIDKVLAWQPPTSEHAGLKEFMLSQLRESIRFDCGMDYHREHADKPQPDFETWRRDRIVALRKEIERCRESYEEEVDRTNKRNAWIRELRESLK